MLLGLVYAWLLAWRFTRPAGAGAVAIGRPQPPITSSAPASPLPPPQLAMGPPPRALTMPIEGYSPSSLRDAFEELRGTRRHEAIDILAPRGTPVLAVDDGAVRKLFLSERGGVTLYQFDPSGTFCYYYAHLERYAEGIHEGQVLARGQRLGYVGTTGNAPKDAPHLHFAVYRLPPDKSWWKGIAINPYPLLAGQPGAFPKRV